MNKCSDQLLRCYSVNRRMKNPMQFYVSSYEGKFKEVLSKHNGAENWDVCTIIIITTVYTYFSLKKLSLNLYGL